MNVDGAYFGTSFPHLFLQNYPLAVILPPKVYHYEPKIYGFKIAGKRGSKYFKPPTGNVRFVEDSMQRMELEALPDNRETTTAQRQPSSDKPKLLLPEFNKKLNLNDNTTEGKDEKPAGAAEDNMSF